MDYTTSISPDIINGARPWEVEALFIMHAMNVEATLSSMGVRYRRVGDRFFLSDRDVAATLVEQGLAQRLVCSACARLNHG